MRQVVLDTNVIVSAAIQPKSAPATLVMDWVFDGQVQTALCPSIANEYRNVIRRAKFRRYGFPSLWLDLLIEESLHLPNPRDWPTLGPDPMDMPLALAHVAGAWLVTGHFKHFPKAIRNGVMVLSPADYLNYLEQGSRETFQSIQVKVKSTNVRRSVPSDSDASVGKVVANLRKVYLCRFRESKAERFFSKHTRASGRTFCAVPTGLARLTFFSRHCHAGLALLRPYRDSQCRNQQSRTVT
jgi:predicted nucleic acid-binding protein